MTAVSPEASRQAVVEAALVLLERMGLSPADLAAVPSGPPGGADVRRVRPGGVGGGQRRDPGAYRDLRLMCGRRVPGRWRRRWGCR